jgi:hypothetical protein
MSLFYHHALGYGILSMHSLELKNSRQATISAIEVAACFLTAEITILPHVDKYPGV